MTPDSELRLELFRLAGGALHVAQEAYEWIVPTACGPADPLDGVDVPALAKCLAEACEAKGACKVLDVWEVRGVGSAGSMFVAIRPTQVEAEKWADTWRAMDDMRCVEVQRAVHTVPA